MTDSVESGYPYILPEFHPDKISMALPEKGSYVEGVLWKITEACEKSLDFYEGFPSFYGKESIRVKNQDGVEKEVFVYMMNAPHKDVPAKPSKFYLDGILSFDFSSDTHTCFYHISTQDHHPDLPADVSAHFYILLRLIRAATKTFGM